MSSRRNHRHRAGQVLRTSTNCPVIRRSVVGEGVKGQMLKDHECYGDFILQVMVRGRNILSSKDTSVDFLLVEKTGRVEVVTVEKLL